MEELDLGSDLTYSEKPIKILDTAERENRNHYRNSTNFRRPEAHGNRLVLMEVS
jgi:hypothetical protein